MIFCDMHTHTSCSDGTYAPDALVSLAKLRGLSMIAITDHDTVDGIERAREVAPYYALDVVSGVELSCEYMGSEVHLLGYFIDVGNSDLLSVLAKQRMRRRNRMDEMVARLRDAGLSISLDMVLENARGGVVGRPHLARVLIDRGYARDIREVYSRFIGYDCPYYVPTRRLNLGEAVEVIIAAGGLPVLAHPIFVASRLLPRIVDDFPLWGIEVYYPEHNPRFVLELESLAREKGLACTGGSDFHGSAKKEDFLGRVGLTKEQAKAVFDCYV